MFLWKLHWLCVTDCSDVWSGKNVCNEYCLGFRTGTRRWLFHVSSWYHHPLCLFYSSYCVVQLFRSSIRLKIASVSDVFHTRDRGHIGKIESVRLYVLYVYATGATGLGPIQKKIRSRSLTDTYWFGFDSLLQGPYAYTCRRLVNQSFDFCFQRMWLRLIGKCTRATLFVASKVKFHRINDWIRSILLKY